MDITQLVLYSLILYEPDAQESFHPLHLLLNAPDPPSKELLKQSLTALSFQGLVNYDLNNADNVTLTPLGKIASSVPASPHIGRMLMMGFVLRAVDPAFQIAGLLSVPKVFSWSRYDDKDDSSHTSDIVKVLELYRAYLESDEDSKRRNPKRFEFQLVTRIEKQLRFTMKDILESGTKIRLTDEDWAGLNANSGRVAALAALICCATRNIAHLVHGHSDFASRDVPGQAKIHPSSVNFSYRRRAHWYVYHELRTTKSPYMHITTAVSPLEVALFAEASEFSLKKFVDRTPRTAKYRLQGDDWLFVADQWVPVSVTNDFQKDSFLKLRRLLTFDFLQEAAQNPKIMVEDATRQRIMLFVLSMIEQQRIKRKNT
jgi:HrpA-like RNA helicase